MIFVGFGLFGYGGVGLKFLGFLHVAARDNVLEQIFDGSLQAEEEIFVG